MAFTQAPLPHPPPDWDAHVRALEALLARLDTHAMLAELADGRARYLHDLTSPAERRVLYLEALRRRARRAGDVDVDGVLWTAERMLPRGVLLDGTRQRRQFSDDPVHTRVRRGLVAALLQLERQGLVYEYAPHRRLREWRVLE